MSEKTKKRIRIAALIIFLIVTVGLTVICLPILPMLASAEGRQRLEALVTGIVEENLILGVGTFLLLQILQVVVALIPGGLIQILGGVIFGGFWGTVLCLLGTFLGEVIVFYVVRWLGMPVVEAIIDAKGIKKLSFLQDTKKCEIAVFILFLLPLMPKDALTYLAPLTKIKPSTFFLLSMLARSPALIVSNVFGSSLSEGNIFIAVMMFLIAAIVGLICIFYRERIIDIFRTARKPKADNTQAERG